MTVRFEVSVHRKAVERECAEKTLNEEDASVLLKEAAAKDKALEKRFLEEAREHSLVGLVSACGVQTLRVSLQVPCEA